MWYMIKNVTASTTARATPERVWAVLADLRSWPTWLPTVTGLIPDQPEREEGTGAAYRVRQPRLGWARWQITAWSPGRSFTWVSRRPGVTTTATHQLTATSEGTRIALGITWAGPGSPVLGWLAGRLTQRYLDTEARALAARSERVPVTDS